MGGDILIYAEQRDGKLQKVAFELVGKGTELAKELGCKVVAVLLGSDVSHLADELIHYGADEVALVDNEMLKEYVTEPYAKAVTQVIKERNPEIVLFGATSIGRDLAPRISARIKTGLTADCTKLEIHEETKHLHMTRPAFGGNIMATIICTEHRPQMATVRPGVMKANTKDTSRTGSCSETKVDFSESDLNVKVLEVIKQTKHGKDITEEKVLISGGRGMKEEAFNGALRDLANVLDGEVTASRAAVDAGFREKAYQVGQTGKTVRPNLYVACGISGAIQHVAGMEESECIIAINKNNTAPIFEVADVGIVGDANVVVPKLVEALKKYKN